MIDKNSPVGVFDSGIGGLTVAREIMRQSPNEKIVYFGDTARVPYGSKSKETITRYSRQIVRFLQAQKVKVIVVACNTASAFALDEIEKEVDIPMIGVVKPGAKVAAMTTRNGKIGVIGTEGTINSSIYSRYIKNINPQVTVTGKACPLFTPLVEEGLWQDPVTDEIAKRYLAELLDIGIDTLILGCTHYPLIRSTVGRIMGEGVKLVNPAYETARELRELLEEKGILNDEPAKLGDDRYRFYVSDAADKFKRFANSIIKYGILSAKITNIEEYQKIMTKEILLSLKGLQMEYAEDADAVETITPADYYRKGSSHYIVYDEMTEGFTDSTRNIIRFQDSYLEVFKRGLINVRMVFEKNKKNITSYQTPFGNILIGVDTESVQIDEKENQINVQVAYTLEANYQYLADCRIEMELRPRKDGISLS